MLPQQGVSPRYASRMYSRSLDARITCASEGAAVRYQPGAGRLRQQRAAGCGRRREVALCAVRGKGSGGAADARKKHMQHPSQAHSRFFKPGGNEGANTGECGATEQPSRWQRLAARDDGTCAVLGTLPCKRVPAPRRSSPRGGDILGAVLRHEHVDCRVGSRQALPHGLGCCRCRRRLRCRVPLPRLADLQAAVGQPQSQGWGARAGSSSMHSSRCKPHAPSACARVCNARCKSGLSGGSGGGGGREGRVKRGPHEVQPGSDTLLLTLHALASSEGCASLPADGARAARQLGGSPSSCK